MWHSQGIEEREGGEAEAEAEGGGGRRGGGSLLKFLRVGMSSCTAVFGLVVQKSLQFKVLTKTALMHGFS